MSDAKYFTRGKVEELRADLHSDKKDPKYTKKKSTLKRIVANMTMGNDMSSLFPDVLACMQLPNVEVKKMVYLYLINYAKTAPELVIMAVNTFLRDALDSDPLVRALAIRTMGYLNVDKIQANLVEPLRHGFKDPDPYVRKTVAITVAKMFINNPSLTETEGYIQNLEELLADPNPTVVANAAAALIEIYDRDLNKHHSLSSEVINKMLSAMSETNEWGSTYILEAIMFHVPRDSKDALTIAERITSRLQHANAGVILSAVKVIVYMMNFLTNADDVNILSSKLGPPLVCRFEKHFAARAKYPHILKNQTKVFFCKYNDPIYVKLSKLEVIMILANEENVEPILSELKEYASEVDVDFVRKSVRSIGICAVKIESAAEKCVAVLVDLIQTKVNYVVQEAIVVIKDIFRKYPNRYESIIGILCENLDNLDEPGAKASMIWIIGHYSDRIENSHELLESFLDSFKEEPEEVQLALLTATVKLFIKRPTVSQELVSKVLKWATDVDNPDLRDRGFIYWRLLSADPAATKSILLSDRPPISTDTDNLDPILLQELLNHLSTLSSLIQRPPHLFLEGFRRRPFPGINPHYNLKGLDGAAAAKNSSIPGDLSLDRNTNFSSSYQESPVTGGQIKQRQSVNLLDLDEPEEIVQQNTASVLSYYNSVLNDNNNAPASVPGKNPLDLLEDSLAGVSINSGPMMTPPTAIPTTASGISDLLSFGGSNVSGGGIGGGLGDSGSSFYGDISPYTAPIKSFISAQQAKGLDLSGRFVRRAGKIFMDLVLVNKALEPIADFAIQFNKNPFGLKPVNTSLPIRVLPPSQTYDHSFPVSLDGQIQTMNPLNQLQVAIKHTHGVFYFATLLPLSIFFVEETGIDREAFLGLWKNIPETSEVTWNNIPSSCSGDVGKIKRKLIVNNINVVADRNVSGTESSVFGAIKLHNQIVFLVEVAGISASQPNTVRIKVRTFSAQLLDLLKESITNIMA